MALKTDPGLLNRRVTICNWRSVQDGIKLREEFEPIQSVWASIEPIRSLTYWLGKLQLDTAATHRIVMRRINGVTRPEDLTGRHAIEHGGQYFQVLRATDLDGALRFTAVEACLWGAQDGG